MQENEASTFCFTLTSFVTPAKVKVSESGIKCQKSMVPISMARMKKSVRESGFKCQRSIVPISIAKMKNIWLKSLFIMSNVTKFLLQK